LLLGCFLVLGLGTWRQLVLANRKQALLDKVKSTQLKADENESLTAKLTSEYESLRPAFASQQNTLDVLNSLALLQTSRSNRSFWYVALADQPSYFNIPREPITTRWTSPVRTNATDGSNPLFFAFEAAPATSTNSSIAKPGLIAQLSIPEDAETSRILLSQLVKSLKQDPLFSKVDLLSEDLRRNIADPKVVVTNRVYVLALDFSIADFQAPGHGRKPHIPRRNPKGGSSLEDADRQGSGTP
jgi:hypothetical protein